MTIPCCLLRTSALLSKNSCIIGTASAVTSGVSAAALGRLTVSRAFAVSSSFSFSTSSSQQSLSALIKELRAQSGAPIVDCKKALEKCGNDMQAAFDWLREHGAAKASSKVAGRATLEGLVGLKFGNSNNGDSLVQQADNFGTSAALVKVASETDFAGRSGKFVELVLHVADATLQQSSLQGALEEAFLLQATSSEGKTVKDHLDEAIVAIRENLSVSEAMRLISSAEDERSLLVGYVHNRIGALNVGSAAAVVEVAPIEGSSGADVSLEQLQATGKKLAMHVVAARPLYLTPEDVPDDELEKEKAILSKEVVNTGKKPEMVEKIVLGKLRKFYESVCLTEQAHLIEEKNPKVSKVLQEQGIVVKNFRHLYIS